MALFGYQQQVQLLLADVTQEKFNPGDLATYINEARGQIAADGECIRAMATTATTQGVSSYAYTSFTTSASGVGGVGNIRSIWYGVGTGQQYVCPKGFEWFGLYYLNNPLAPQGPPDVWSLQGQGLAGTVYLGPTPDQAYTLTADAVCYPVNLTSDSTAEAIPAYWTDCVQFLACFYALINASMQDDADRMFRRYALYRDRARQFSNPSVLPGIWAQSVDRTLPNKLGAPPDKSAA